MEFSSNSISTPLFFLYTQSNVSDKYMAMAYIMSSFVSWISQFSMSIMQFVDMVAQTRSIILSEDVRYYLISGVARCAVVLI